MIKLVKQTWGSGCGHACVAMLAGISIEEVASAMSREALTDQTLWEALSRFEVPFSPLLYPKLVFAGWYVMVVPSLNIRGGMHYVVVLAEKSGKLRLFDPSSENTYAPDGSDLISWTNLVLVEPRSAAFISR